MRKARALFLLALFGAFFAAPAAFADDVADEADLQFRLGAERYQAADYRGALEHFLASNRLVRNKNALYNVARTYEQLARYPEAFRYYEQALVAETDAAARAELEKAVERIRPHVAVLDVETDPPGATLYLDRLDLGPRGDSPTSLGVVAGRYKVIAVLAGYHAAEAVVADALLGHTTEVRLVLEPILGKLQISGAATSARVRVDGDTGVPRCVVPCTLDLSPGAHVLHLSLEGRRDLDVPVEISPQVTRVIEPRLDMITGTLLVTTDEPGALVEIDGSTGGFTPTVLTLPTGPHDISISLHGYHPVKRTVEVPADRRSRLDVPLVRLEEVEAASRVSESVEDAPSSVTIIPREELLAFGYPTIADAVNGVQGLYTWNDRSYQSVGVRGLGRVESYNNRELVLADGHPTNDDWVGSAYVGFEGRTDLADVERIEVVRGPGSVLYGTNAFSGVINLVSRYKETPPGVEVGLSAVDAGVARARVRAQASLGKDAGVWTSVGALHGVGRDFYFPELGSSTVGGDGNSRGADGSEGGTVQGRLFYKWATVQWFFNSYDKALPTGEFKTLLGDSGTHQTDTRSFIEARAEPTFSKYVQLLSRAHWNADPFRGQYVHTAALGGVEEDSFDGAWAGLEERVVVTPDPRLRITVGGEGQYHYKVDTTARDSGGYFLEEANGAGRPYEVGAVYLLADATPAERVRLSGGVRLDGYSTFGTSLNPRVSAILRPYARGNTKLILGKAFRAPSIYELHYNDGGTTQVASPSLRPESIYSAEVEHSHRFSPTITAMASVYANYVTNLIVERGAADTQDPLHYINETSPLMSLGGEIGVRREWRQGYMLQASYGYQHSRYLASTKLSDVFGLEQSPSMRHVENSPAHLASLKAAVPLWSRAVTAATRLTFQGARYDRYESEGPKAPAQERTDAAVIWDLVLSGREEHSGIDYSVGAYNVTGWRYSVPVSIEFAERTIPQNGRTFLVSVTYTH